MSLLQLVSHCTVNAENEWNNNKLSCRGEKGRERETGSDKKRGRREEEIAESDIHNESLRGMSVGKRKRLKGRDGKWRGGRRGRWRKRICCMH